MSVRQYIGARYVPIFKGNWDVNAEYEPLTVVQHNGNSYTSRQSVPSGIDINNEDYWVLTGNYNAQVEQYRQEVRTFDSRITSNTNSIAENAADIAANTADIATNTANITANADGISANTAAIATNAGNIAENTTDISNHETRITSLEGKVENLETGQMVVIGDSWSHHYNSSAATQMWDVRVARALNLELHNYATGAVGYMRDKTNCFYDQLTTAYNDSNIDVQNVRKVFIFGGLNDVYRSEVTLQLFQTSVEQTFARAQALFPNSEIVVMGIQRYQGGNVAYNDANQYLGFDKISLFTEAMFDKAMNDLNSCRLIDMRYCGLFTPSFYQTDGHPTLTRGHRTIASKVLGGSQMMNGSNGNFFGDDAFKPTITLNNVTTKADRCEVGIQGGNLATLSFLFFVDPQNMQTGQKGVIDFRGAPHPCVWPRILGIDTCEMTTIDPEYANNTIAAAGANELQWCNTYNVPYTRGTLRNNGLFEVTYSIEV